MTNLLLIALVPLAMSACADDWKPVPIPGVDMKCFQEETPVSWSFCVNRLPSSGNQDVVYHFHGRNGSADWWNDQTYYTGKVHAQWIEQGVAPPTVVTVSFGKLWLLTERPDEATGGLYRVFIDDVLSRVETEIPHSIGRRSLVGESMGGVNALTVALKSGRLFARAASLCPPIQRVSPFSSASGIFRYVTQTSTSWRRALMMLLFSRKFYPNEEVWANNDPLQLARNYLQPSDVRLYLTCGEKDDWGCMEGSKAFVKALEEKGGKVDWYPRPGGHCDIDVESLAKFLVERATSH